MATSIDYGSVPHETIYQHITGGPGSAALEDVSWDCQGVATKLQALQDLVDQAVRGIGVAQQGAAADAATQATMALIPWLADLVTAANRAAAQVSDQAAFFAYTRDNMPEPRTIPDVSFNQDPETWIADHALEWLPGIQTEHERALVAAQQAEQRARELMNGYQGTSNENLAIPPYFPTAPTVVFDVASPAPGGVGIGGANGGWGTQQRPTHSDLAHPLLAYSGPVAGAASAPLAEGLLPAGTASQLVSGVHQVPAPAPTVAQLAGGYPNPGEELMAGSVQPAAAAPLWPSPILAGSSVAGGDRSRGGSRLSGAGGGNPDGGFGPRPRAAFDSPLSGSHGQNSTGQNNTGQNNTGQPSAGRAARSDAGWADVPLGAPGGCGRTGGTEHRRPSYLIEQDTNAIVGELPRVAPPVIGADEDYH
ncbi:MAG: PPE domain-containing protein [Pseudonocardiaceae bacterium]